MSLLSARMVYSTPIRSKQALDLAQVADGIAVEAADEVDLLVGYALQLGSGAGFAIPEVFDNALHDVVVAGDVAADEGRRVGERHVEIRRHRTLLFGVLDEGVQDRRQSPRPCRWWRLRSFWAYTAL